MEDKIQERRYPSLGYPPTTYRGYIDTKKSRVGSTITQVLVRDRGEKRIR